MILLFWGFSDQDLHFHWCIHSSESAKLCRRLSSLQGNKYYPRHGDKGLKQAKQGEVSLSEQEICALSSLFSPSVVVTLRETPNPSAVICIFMRTLTATKSDGIVHQEISSERL